METDAQYFGSSRELLLPVRERLGRGRGLGGGLLGGNVFLWAIPGPSFGYFRPFQTIMQFYTTNKCEK